MENAQDVASGVAQASEATLPATAPPQAANGATSPLASDLEAQLHRLTEQVSQLVQAQDRNNTSSAPSAPAQTSPATAQAPSTAQDNAKQALFYDWNRK